MKSEWVPAHPAIGGFCHHLASRAAKPRRAARPAGDLARRLAALLRLTVEIGAAPDESAICRSVVAGLHEGLGYEFLGLFLVDPATGDRVLRASVGWPDAPAEFRLPPGRGLSELPLQNGEAPRPGIAPAAPASSSPPVCGTSMSGVIIPPYFEELGRRPPRVST